MRLLHLFAPLLSLSLTAIAHAETFTVDPGSILEWTGKKVTGEHHGTVAIKDGTVTFDGNKLLSGAFDIDMSSITVLDIKDPKYNDKLTNHLKSDDFFNINQFPSSSYKITSAEVIKEAKDLEPNFMIHGDLTIKGVTFPLSFPARVDATKNSATAEAHTKVDRTKYNVRYGSGKFFENLGDKLIYDDFEIEMHLKASSRASSK